MSPSSLPPNCDGEKLQLFPLILIAGLVLVVAHHYYLVKSAAMSDHHRRHTTVNQS